MIQLKNPKLIFKGELFLIDAPEEPCKDKCESTSYCFDSCDKYDSYQEAISKAPAWEVKNREEVIELLREKQNEDPRFEHPLNWKPEQGKVYHLPKGYGYKFETNHCSLLECTNHESGCYYIPCKEQKFAILLPQEEVKEESQEELFTIYLGMIWQMETARPEKREAMIEQIKSKFHITRITSKK